MENEMIERVMKAIAACPYPEGDDPLDDETLGEAIVRAAIAAMREPTEAMIEAMETNHDYRFAAHETYGSIGIPKETCVEIYQAMIDIALKSE